MLLPVLARSVLRHCRHLPSVSRAFSSFATAKMPPKDKYSDPKLRDEIKEELMQSDKGGKPGQWSARKAQMMAKEYKKRGGDYNQPKSDKDESQQNLSNWGDEDWQTKEGSGEAKQKDGSRKRYLPKKAWEEMDEKEKQETDEKKLKESKEGKQFVANTGRARRARKEVTEEGEKKEEQKEDKEPAKKGQKRGRGKKDEDDAEEEKQEPSKKQKASSDKKSSGGTVGSKHDKADPPAQQASASRLPKKGRQAYWKAMPGWVDGKVVEVLKANKEVDGKQVKASKEGPRIVLKSNAKSQKICVHKPEAVYFD